MHSVYSPERHARSRFVELRGLRHHLLEWGDASLAAPQRPLLVLLHGWMDVAASFQFVVDALASIEGEVRHVVALDWRGFGLTQAPGRDCYWFPDYLGDLDAVLDALAGTRAVDLAGHSMGANVAMLYAGVRAARVRKLVNLEGFGMPDSDAARAPQRYAQWLDQLKAPPRLRSYDTLAAVAERLIANNPRLAPDKADWLAAQWATRGGDGRWQLRADAAHKLVNPVLYRKDEALACWKAIAAPVLWVEADATDVQKWWGHRYPREDFEARLAVVPRLQRRILSQAGHMLHHDQPHAVAACLKAFLDDA